jgi:hypothetical protein
MSLRSRASAVGRWGGVAAVVVIAALWLVSGWRMLRISYDRTGFVAHCLVVRGQLAITLGSGPGFVDSGGALVKCEVQRYPKEWGSVPGWGWSPVEFQRQQWREQTVYFRFALWVLFLAAACVAALLWYRRLRVPPGLCRKCRYDLRGVTTGVCPECGAAMSGG